METLLRAKIKRGETYVERVSLTLDKNGWYTVYEGYRPKDIDLMALTNKPQQTRVKSQALRYYRAKVKQMFEQ